MSEKVVLLGNPTSGAGSADLGSVLAELRRRGVDPEVLTATSAADAIELAGQAVTDGADRLVAVGGDGMVHLALGAVATTTTVLGIVPEGTGNDFARALGLLDGSMRDHVGRALAPAVPVGAIRTQHGWVASIATLGFSGDVTARANALRWPRGAQRYTVATLGQLPRLRTVSVTVTVDGVEHAVDTTLLAVGNTPFFGGGMRVCPGADPTSGMLEVVVIGAVSRRTFLRVFPRVFSGRHVTHPSVTVRRGEQVTIAQPSGDRAPVEVLWADGDPLGPLPVVLEAVPEAVLVAGARPPSPPPRT